MSKNKKIAIGIIAAGLFIGLAFGGKFALDFMYYNKAMSSVTIEDIDLSRMNDGVSPSIPD